MKLCVKTATVVLWIDRWRSTWNNWNFNTRQLESKGIHCSRNLYQENSYFQIISFWGTSKIGQPRLWVKLWKILQLTFNRKWAFVYTSTNKKTTVRLTCFIYWFIYSTNIKSLTCSYICVQHWAFKAKQMYTLALNSWFL